MKIKPFKIKICPKQKKKIVSIIDSTIKFREIKGNNNFN